jgi:hypothetical protein
MADLYILWRSGSIQGVFGFAIGAAVIVLVKIWLINRKYGQAIASFQGLNLQDEQRKLNAYCAGMINERGLLPLKSGDEVRGVIASYPVKMWTWLYENALRASGLELVKPFREPPKPSGFVRLLSLILDKISGS